MKVNTKQIIKAAVVIAVAGGLFLKFGPAGKKQVKVEKVNIGSLAGSSLYSGTVVPGTIVPIYIEASAVVERILAREGEEVTSGTELMIFSNKSLLENERELKMNSLDIKDVELKISDLESGTLKLELDNRKLEIKSLEEKIKNDTRKVPLASKQAKVYEELLKKDGVSSVEATKKVVEYEELLTNLELDRQKYNLMVISYESLNRQLNIEEAKLKSDYEKLKLKRELLVKRDNDLREPLKSPIEGIVIKIDVTEGSITAPGERLVAIATKGENRIVFEVPLYQAQTLEKGQIARITSRESSKEMAYEGVVEKVSSSAKTSARGKDKVVEVEVSINGKNELKPGFIADVSISAKAKSNVPVINNFSVIEEGGNYFVYIVEEGKAVKKEIKVGARGSKNYEVIDLPIGTEVIVNPFKVKNGEKIKVVE